MDIAYLNQLFIDNILYVMAGLIFIVLLLFLLFLNINRKYKNYAQKYAKMMSGYENETIDEMIIGYRTKIDGLEIDVNELKRENISLKRRVNLALKNTSLVRYNAFNDMGSDLSFSLALLNDEDDGFIISSLYGRDENRVYAKPVNKGISSYRLSEEEDKVLTEARAKLSEIK